MTEARYHELLGQLLDGALSGAEAEELRRCLEAEPRRIRDLREHLGLWELWGQEQSPRRSAEAFCRDFQARLQAEREPVDVAGTHAGPQTHLERYRDHEMLLCLTLHLPD